DLRRPARRRARALGGAVALDPAGARLPRDARRRRAAAASRGLLARRHPGARRGAAAAGMKLPLLLLLAAGAAPSAHARVLDLHTEIRVAKSGELTVIERITVEAAKDTTPLERELPREARVVDLVRDGHAQAFVLDGTRLRAGGPPPREGRHLYQLTYRAVRRVAFLGDHDALH